MQYRSSFFNKQRITIYRNKLSLFKTNNGPINKKFSRFKNSWKVWKKSKRTFHCNFIIIKIYESCFIQIQRRMQKIISIHPDFSHSDIDTEKNWKSKIDINTSKTSTSWTKNSWKSHNHSEWLYLHKWW